VVTVRPGGAEDLAAVAAIQKSSPEAAGWDPGEYLPYGFLVAVEQEEVAGFLVTRQVAEGEHEILNLAVAHEFRRRGVARKLLNAWLSGISGDIFLEVRASNQTAQKFYNLMGFQQVSTRPNYYQHPSEPAIVMKFHSC
jgi:[ribosomal protein S18]-alanine N-acetyltransferase